jgi:hypothetical protein
VEKEISQVDVIASRRTTHSVAAKNGTSSQRNTRLTTRGRRAHRGESQQNVNGFRATSQQVQTRSSDFIPCQEFNSTFRLMLTTLSWNQHLRSDCLMNRIVSITLIIAVLQCTFSCTAGRCCAGDSESTVKVHPVKKCCRHCQSAADSSHEREDNTKSGTPAAPCEEHDTKTCICQGACSGMVPCKQVELKAAPNCIPLSLIAEHSELQGCSGSHSHAAVDESSDREAAHGLSMRIRVCSLTC